MKYVNLIRRIDLINKAYDRTPDDDRHEKILDAIWGKRKILVNELRSYMRENAPIGSYTRRIKRTQIKTACRLLAINYHSVVV
jgi:hypothetical protein